MKNLILVTGSNGRFAKTLKKIKDLKLRFLIKKELNILKPNSIEKCLSKYQPKMLIHTAGLSRPMEQHETNVAKSIDLNIIGTANVTKVCKEFDIKLIYFSTNYVYPGSKGNYKEIDPLLPVNNYAWSKLGGEASVQLYKNSLILRVCMTEKPFVHKRAFANVKSNFIYQEDLARIFLKVINKKGLFNIGGKSQIIHTFVSLQNKNIKKIYSKGKFPKNMDMNLSKLNRCI